MEKNPRSIQLHYKTYRADHVMTVHRSICVSPGISWLMGCIFLSTQIPLVELPAADNQLSEEERAAGWKLLFDGRTAAGWLDSRRQPVDDSHVQDGSLNPHPCNYMLVYDQPLTDFELRLDFKIAPRCNSGVFFRTFPLEPRPGKDVGFNGLEVAIDDTQTAGYHDTGAVYDLVKPDRNAMRPAGQWNEMRLKVVGPSISVWINQQLVTELDLDQWPLPNRRPDGSSHKFDVAYKDHPRHGYIGLQDHGSDVWFRNIKLREITNPFGDEHSNLDSLAAGQWWTKPKPRGQNPPPPLDVPAEQKIAFALYTHDHGVLKLTSQLFPLKPDEPREARLELKLDDRWKEIARQPVLYPGWSAHFRIEPWDNTKDVAYRVRHGEAAVFEGLIRRDPRDKPEIVVANMSCNSSRTTGGRAEIVDRLKLQNPDLLFFAGDQTYRHTEHTAGWIEFGLQFRDVIRDRPTITIPDDHDVGHPNLWGENGKQSTLSGNADGGYFYPVEYVNLVQRQQTWHLPDPVDPAPVERGITVYFTRMRVGGIDFAILEDRKFKSGPAGKIPPMGPRPDHINDASYDPRSIDLPGLQLLGTRQHKFLDDWSSDWNGVQIKAVLSQTAFCGAVHMHGKRNDRLLADLDCNGWPQSGRNRALEQLRRVQAVHLCGDQHLAVVVKHGISQFGDGPYAFTSPALVNTIYGRWWHPLNERPGNHAVPGSPLPWTGDFLDGLGNRITMMAYANPIDIANERQRGDGYGLVRFDKQSRRITFECWPRFAEDKADQPTQYAGWPVTINVDDNDGRQVVAYLPELVFHGAASPVVQVIGSTGEIQYTRRVTGTRFRPPVFAPGKYRVRVGRNDVAAGTDGVWSRDGLNAEEASQHSSIDVVLTGGAVGTP